MLKDVSDELSCDRVYAVQAVVKYNRHIMPADEPQAAFTLRAHILPTDSCTTNELRICATLVLSTDT